MDHFDFKNKQVVITGGTQGIGLAIATAFANSGASVVVSSRREGKCKDAAATLNGSGHRGIACDVAKDAEVEALFDQVASGDTKGCDVFIHCAGVSSSKWAKSVGTDEMRKMNDIHYVGGVHCGQRAASLMREGTGGAMVMISSVWGFGASPTTIAYGSAKAALTHAVKVMALEWARDGIRVNGLAPGFVATEMTENLPVATKEKLVSKIPLKRAATPAEMAGPALFLCSASASYVTGQTLIVDGGERTR